MNVLIAAANRKIEMLEAEHAAEAEKIAAAVAAKQIGDGTGYWKKKHELARRLEIAVALRQALAEAAA
jgi:hypothetical protein